MCCYNVSVFQFSSQISWLQPSPGAAPLSCSASPLDTVKGWLIRVLIVCHPTCLQTRNGKGKQIGGEIGGHLMSVQGYLCISQTSDLPIAPSLPIILLPFLSSLPSTSSALSSPSYTSSSFSLSSFSLSSTSFSSSTSPPPVLLLSSSPSPPPPKA